MTTKFVENVPEGADAERVIRELAASGNKLIFTTSFGYMNPTIKVAPQFPTVAFEHATGYKTAKNVGIYNARFYEGRYLCGIIAGKMTKTNVAGYVAAFPIPAEMPLQLALKIDRMAQELKRLSPLAVLASVFAAQSRPPLNDALDTTRGEFTRLRERMIALQEELDWECYQLYGLTEAKLFRPPDEVPRLQLGERAFEIVMARKLAAGDPLAKAQVEGYFPQGREHSFVRMGWFFNDSKPHALPRKLVSPIENFFPRSF